MTNHFVSNEVLLIEYAKDVGLPKEYANLLKAFGRTQDKHFLKPEENNNPMKFTKEQIKRFDKAILNYKRYLALRSETDRIKFAHEFSDGWQYDDLMLLIYVHKKIQEQEEFAW